MAKVTNLGDASVTIAVAVLVFLCFLWSSRAAALNWFAAVLVCGVVTAGGKLALYLYGAPLLPFYLVSPSGHVAASVLVYGVMPMAAERPRRQWVALAVAIIGAIAASRIYLQAHTGSDVVVGAGIGGACLAWFLSRPGSALSWAATPLRVGAGAAAVIGLCGAAAGWRLHLDTLLHAAAVYLGG